MAGARKRVRKKEQAVCLPFVHLFFVLLMAVGAQWTMICIGLLEQAAKTEAGASTAPQVPS
jgi:hypothetical protein